MAEPRPARPLWPWVVIPLVLVALLAAALVLLLPEGGGLSDGSGYRLR